MSVVSPFYKRDRRDRAGKPEEWPKHCDAQVGPVKDQVLKTLSGILSKATRQWNRKPSLLGCTEYISEELKLEQTEVPFNYQKEERIAFS
ncbi:hypothetical protein Cadr_000020714 [Camelus dromedarius]|uniref:Uncharacterized protein n=1 Tax=Camelus dromedarius TaxID=9838 RepID=A0A5N4D0X2_CAMDR|nr:hypothetical protein Cadr_000020714 [Camelus dromedarius]